MSGAAPAFWKVSKISIIDNHKTTTGNATGALQNLEGACNDDSNNLKLL